MTAQETTREAQWRAQGVPEELLQRAEPDEPTALELLADIFDLGGLRKVEQPETGDTLELQFDEGSCSWSAETQRPLIIEGPFGTAPGELAWRAVLEGWGPLEETEEDEEGGSRFLFEHGEAQTDADGNLVGYAPYFEDEEDGDEGE
jgi:hypothetical protein